MWLMDMISKNDLLILLFFITIIFEMGQSSPRRGRKKDEMRTTFAKGVEALRVGQGDLIKELSQLRQDLNSIKRASLNQFPLDCNAARLRGDWRTVTTISPPGIEPRAVRCDQEEFGGGWTVLLRRFSKYGASLSKFGRLRMESENEISLLGDQNHENFNRTWEDYKNGFGDPDDEYWIGNEVIHHLTREAQWEAAVVLLSWQGSQAAAFWDSFRISSEAKKFRLGIGGYRQDSSTIGDGFTYHNGRFFSTEDSDNDDDSVHCAKQYGGGWWFNQCHVVHLTGSHLEPGSQGEHSLHWLPWKGDKQTLQSAVLMIRPKIFH